MSGPSTEPGAVRTQKREQKRTRLSKRVREPRAVAPVADSGNVVIPYLRVSTLGQDTGLEVQWEKIQAWAQFEGVKLRSELLAGAFVDKVSGASADNRPGFKAALRQALECAERGPTTLVVYRLDRLGRNAVDVQEALAVLLDAGVRVVALCDGVDSASGMGEVVLKLLVSILSTVAELERETIRTRLLDGRRRASAQNRPYASEPAYGRRVGEDGLLHEDADELAALALIKNLHSEGKSARFIADELLAAGHKPRRALTWAPSVVHRIATGKRSEKKASKRGRVERVRAEILGK